MAIYSSSAVFNAVDNISNVVSNIGDNVVRMGDRVQQQMISMGQATGGFEGALFQLAGVGIGPVMGVVGAGINQFVSLGDVMAGVSARTGMTGQALTDFKNVVNTAFANQGATTDIREMADAVEKVRQKVGALDNMTLAKLSTEVLGVAKAFGGTDPGSLAETIGNTMSRFDDMAGKPTLVLDNIVALAQQTGDPLSEVQGRVETLGSKFAGAGLSGTQMFTLMYIAANLGITNVGGIATAFDGFTAKVQKEDPKTMALLRQLGLQDTVKLAQQGQITYGDLISDVLTTIGSVQDPAKKSADALALFGPVVDKIGGPDALGKLGLFVDKMRGPNGIEGAAQRATSTMDSSFGGFISGTWNKFTTTVSTGVDQVYRTLTQANWQGAMDKIKGVIEPAWKAVFDPQTGWFATMVPKAFEGISKWIADNTGKIFEWFQGAANTIKRAWDDFKKFIEDIWQKIKDILSAPDKLSEAMGGGHAAGKDPGGGGKGTGHAWGGFLDEGPNIVGEQGAEMAWKRGSSVQIFTNRETKQILGSGTGGGGRVTNQYFNIGHLVGSGGMIELARMLKTATQYEDQRRSTG